MVSSTSDVSANRTTTTKSPLGRLWILLLAVLDPLAVHAKVTLADLLSVGVVGRVPAVINFFMNRRLAVQAVIAQSRNVSARIESLPDDCELVVNKRRLLVHTQEGDRDFVS